MTPVNWFGLSGSRAVGRESPIAMDASSQFASTDRTSQRLTRVSSATLRMVYAIILVPIVPAASAIGTNAISNYGTLAGFDGFRWFEFTFSVLWVAGTIVIWRRAILWTLGRRWLTALISLIPFVQIVYNQPLWNAGCISDDVLRAGQHQVSVGLWTWLAIWVWWGMEKLVMNREETQQNAAATQMSPIARRLLASIGMLPFVLGWFLVVSVAMDKPLGMPAPLSLPLTFAVTAVVALVTWCLLWRRMVYWSESVVWKTIVAWFAMVAVPIGLQFPFLGKPGGLLETVLNSLPIIGWGVWLAWTVWYWPIHAEMVGVAAVEPHCLKCGYSLRGLSATRCPECGDEPTIDQLWLGLQSLE